MRKHRVSSPAEPGREGRGFRQIIVLLALAFVVTLGVVVGTRMSSDAIAVLVGVIAGVAASIPCALLLVVVTRRREREEEDDTYEEPRYEPSRAAPPVIVVTPGAQQQLPYGAPSYGPPSYGALYGDYAQLQGGRSGRRQFRVMGYDQEEDQPVEGEGGNWYQ
jgi:hypothetical protein